MQKYKASIIRTQERTIFNPINLMEKRREKRMKRMEQNTRDAKKQIIHKNHTKWYLCFFVPKAQIILYLKIYILERKIFLI